MTIRRWALALPVGLLLAAGWLAPDGLRAQEAATPAATEEVASEPAPAAPTAAEEPAEEAGPATYDAFTEDTAEFSKFAVNNLWILISAALVFIMHLGFSAVESGLCQSKNTNNILFKNVFIVCIGALGYMFYGFNAMYPGWEEAAGKFFAVGSPLTNDFKEDADIVANMTSAYADYTYWADFIFQAMFAATAATIVSGAVAERVKLPSFMIYAAILVTFIYPITGSWEWGGGWLNGFGGENAGDTAQFIDFAGSSLVHAFGGFAALGAVLVLGPRKGKYLPNGGIRPILPHSTPLATIGVFMLFLGWFGFNGGSVLSADPQGVSRVFVTTGMAGFAGGLGALFCSWIVIKKPDLSMSLNGMLAGLVGITAGAGAITPYGAVVVGLIAGCLVVLSVLFFDKLRIDDPVGAISVHGICGIWGTLAVGIFGKEHLAGEAVGFMPQLIGTLSVSVFAFVCSFLLFSILKVTLGIRVSEEEELKGLDVEEHGAPAYHFGTDVNEMS